MTKRVRGETSAELRANYLDESFAPTCREVFQSDDRLKSFVLAIAQYWADDAADDVHLEIIPCVTPNPTWPECLNANPFVDGDTMWTDLEMFDRVYDTNDEYPRLSERAAITAFASCCHEISTQDRSLSESYRPYAIAKRGSADDVTIEVVGAVVRPEWEDAFNLRDDEGRRTEHADDLLASAYEHADAARAARGDTTPWSAHDVRWFPRSGEG